MSEERLNQNNVVLNTEIPHEQQAQNDLGETLLKTNSRPQRQAAKKAENQIRVNICRLKSHTLVRCLRFTNVKHYKFVFSEL